MAHRKQLLSNRLVAKFPRGSIHRVVVMSPADNRTNLRSVVSNEADEDGVSGPTWKNLGTRFGRSVARL